jgi:hypothetical protein
MSVTAAAGHPDYSGTFIPVIWSSKFNTKFYDSTVLGAIANTDYEGEIKNHGDKVEIRQTPNTTINDYQKGGTLKVQRPEEDNVQLLIDKGKYFNCILDDVDKVQSDLDLLDNWSDDASEQMKIKIDEDVFDNIYDDPDTYNAGATAGYITQGFNLGTSGSAVTPTKTDILDYLVDCGTVLDERNVPESGRWMVLPPYFCGMIKKSDLKDASLAGDGTSIMRNGRLGMIDRFEIFRSNLLYYVSGDTAWYCMFGHKVGLTFASQMTNMETLRAESTFGTLLRGLQVYGYKVTQDDALGALYAAKS